MRRSLPSKISLKKKDLKIAKFGNAMKEARCNDELETYLNAISLYGSDKDVPKHISFSLADCMDAPRAKKENDGIKTYLSKLVTDRKRNRRFCQFVNLDSI